MESLKTFNSDNELDSINDEPALIEFTGDQITSKQWYKDGLLHRENGPAHIEYWAGHPNRVCLLCGDSDLKKSKRLSHDKIIREHNKLMRAINSDLCKALDDVELKSLIHTIETSSKSVVVLYTKHDNLFIQHLAKAVIDE